MTTQEALAIVSNGGIGFTYETFLEAQNLLLRDLKVLEIFKKHLYIRINEEPSFDDTYLVALQEDEEQECDYTCIFVNKEEKELLKGWLKNDK